MKVIFSSVDIPMTYSQDELSNLIETYMRDNDSFSYSRICSYIFNRAKQENRIKQERDTEYQGGIRMSYSDETLISRLLWEQIWDKKLYINFSKNPYFVQNNEWQFVVNKVCK